MFNTAFKGITTLSRNALFHGGICKWYYAKVEDVEEWPVVNPVTQEYNTQPVLREGAVWYGPVKVPDGSLGLSEIEKKIPAGSYWEIKLDLTQPGDERNSRVNLRNLGLHRYVAIAQTRAGGMFLVIGSLQSPLELRREYSTGTGKNSTAGSRIFLATESKDPCIGLASFNGVNSLPPVFGDPETLPPLPAGGLGWSPVLAAVTDGERRVLQVTDWTGGEGTKPTTGQYVGATGLVIDIADAVDIRGAQGEPGLPAINYAKRHAIMNFGIGVAESYCGTAPYNSGESEPDESDPVWTVKRIWVMSHGATEVLQATNVTWTDFLTHTYT